MLHGLILLSESVLPEAFCETVFETWRKMEPGLLVAWEEFERVNPKLAAEGKRILLLGKTEGAGLAYLATVGRRGAPEFTRFLQRFSTGAFTRSF